jgi:hypothetical protein
MAGNFKESEIISERVDKAMRQKISEQLFCQSVLELLKKYWYFNLLI